MTSPVRCVPNVLKIIGYFPEVNLKVNEPEPFRVKLTESGRVVFLDVACCGLFSPPHSPMNRAAIVFMISLVPAKIRVTRMSRQARAIGYSSQ